MNKRSKATYSAFETAIYYITFKDRTEKEIRDKLNEKGYSESDIEVAVEKLYEYRYLDDENYALSYFKSNVRKKGVRLISSELANKGIDPEISRESLLQIDVDEYQTVFDMMKKRYGNSDFNDDSQRRKIYSYFVRRGFQYENIYKAMSFFRKNGEN